MKDSGKPIYREIIDYIKDAIKDGRYGKGELIPTEEEFCNLFNTSRMTVRRAIDDLVSKGMLTRIRGKGTFVARFNIEKTMNSVSKGWSETMEALGFKTYSKVLMFNKIKADEYISDNLKIPLNSEVYVLERLRYADDNPAVIEKVFISADRFPVLNQYTFENESFYDILRRNYNIKINHSYQKLKAVQLVGEKAKLFSKTGKAIVIEITSTNYDQYSKPIEFGIDYVNSDIYVLRYVIKE
ncbi:GntR family transcriptional regulator [Candidatus Clostridium radicumherbarum]|uniref:GntR family transcriptional regulator n=1 Tax=Candidatus Clostridium radicumherbarum TaxID=3381662 RepID=A0ABW8TNZ9_9CLOT